MPWPRSRCWRKNLAARPLCPPEMLGSMAAVELGDDPDPPAGFVDQQRLNQELFERFRIEVPVYFFPASPRVVLRRFGAGLQRTGALPSADRGRERALAVGSRSERRHAVCLPNTLKDRPPAPPPSSHPGCR